MRESTVYMEDSRAEVNPSVLQEEKKEKRMIDTSGLNTEDSLEILDLIGWWVKMYLESSDLPLTQYVRTWSKKVTPLGFSILRLRLSERSTEEIESSLLPTGKTSHLWRTPDAHCDRGASSKERIKKKVEQNLPISLNDQVKHEQFLFPTPTTFDATCGDLKGKEYTGKNRHSMKLIQAVKKSPVLTDSSDKQSQTSKGTVIGGLNPRWVAWLQGFPPNWTEVD